ncbi:MAG: hypothetical protein KDB07_10170 [Planctomycetes bacterium]|nr:hypothetical protein [Planctomycetota bacterium]
MRETWQELNEIIHELGVKKVAAALGISSSLIYKWCQAPKSDANPEASGASNPLDRLFIIMELAGDERLIEYIARRAGGYFIPNPVHRSRKDLSFVSETMAILDKYADLMRFAEQSLSNDGKIDHDEAITLRRDWDKLKVRLETFVMHCEAGDFDIVKEDD